MEPGNEQLCAGLAEGELEPSGGGRKSGPAAAEVGRIVRETCRRFARDVDWQHRRHIASNGGGEGPGCGLSEDHEGLHSGRYISVNVVPRSGYLVVRGGYYDRRRQPQSVYRQSLPLARLTAQGLASLLREMHDGLGCCHRGRST